MYQNAFEKLELEEIATILDQLNPEFDGAQFDPVETTIMAQELAFYPGFRFLDIADHSVMPAMKRFALYSPEKTTVLNFTNEPIYKLNQELPIALSKDTVEDYVRFFFAYVRGRHGRFIVTEDVDDINWKDEPPPAARKAIGKMLIPVALQNVEKDGTYILEACVMFKDSLFKCKVQVKLNGFISLTDEELLIEDMPVLDDVFGQ